MQHHLNSSPNRTFSAMVLIVLCAFFVGCQPTPHTFSGRVLDADDGSAIANVHIRVAGQDLLTDREGYFEAILDVGNANVRVSAPGYVRESFTVSIRENVLSHIRDIVLKRRRLPGLVQDESTNRPLAGVHVRYDQEQTVTDQDGCFDMEAMTEAALSISRPGYLPLRLSEGEIATRLGISGVLTAPLAISLPPRVLLGTVIEAGSKKPISGALVSVGDLATRSDAEGHYELRAVEPGTRIAFSSPDHRPLASVVYDGQSREDVTLEPWQVTLIVLDGVTGEPLPGAQIAAGEALRLTDDRGRATLRLPPDTRLQTSGDTLQISHDGYRPLGLVYEGQETLEAALEPSRLTLSLWDSESGEPISRTLIQAFTAKEEMTPTLTRSDDDGRAVWEDAIGTGVADITRLTIKAPGYRRVSVAITRGGRLDMRLEPFQVRGIYVPFGLLTLPDRIAELLDLVEESELNAIVVDVKSDRARLAWVSDVPLALELDAYQKDVMDLKDLVGMCHDRGIYTIARMVVFKDNLLATKHHEWAVTREEGGLYKDLEGLCWVDPFRQEVRDYNIALAREVAAMGFDEIQLDYLRFPSDGRVKGLVYSEESNFELRTAAMAEFCAQVYEALSPTPAFISADLFGLTVWVDPSRDMGIGQRVDDIAPHMDYISPMLYPSTFGKGNLGFDDPVLHPYEVVYHSVLKTKKRTPTRVRPWLQHYSLGGVIYGTTELLKQKKGAEEAGSCGWLYWNAGGKYRPEIFQPGANTYPEATRDSSTANRSE